MFRSISFNASFRAILIACAAAAFPGLTSAAAVIVQPSFPQSSPGAGACPIGQTLDFYVTNFGQPSPNAAAPTYPGCTIGIATFYGFRAFGFTPTTTINLSPTNLLLNAQAIAPPPGFLFTGAGLSNATGTAASEFTFEYFIDPPIDILGLGLADAPPTGGASVTQTACVGAAFFVGDGVSCPSGNQVSLTINGSQPSDAVTFGAPTRFVDVMTTVILPAGGAVPDFTTGAIVAPVPEPHELALSGIGGLMLLGTMLRNRRRSKKASLVA
jgi:hypothetical protein